MSRLLKEIENLPHVTSWESAPAALVYLGAARQTQADLQLVPPEQVLAGEASDIFTLAEKIRQPWVLILAEGADVFPHALMTLMNALEQDTAYTMGTLSLGKSGVIEGFQSACSRDPGNALFLGKAELLKALSHFSQDTIPNNGKDLLKALASVLSVKSLPGHLIRCNPRDFLPPVFPKEKNRKRLLVISHEYSLTGAPIVLRQALEILRDHGYEIHVISPEDGPVYDQLAQEHFSVSFDRRLKERDEAYFRYLGEHYDGVILNTVVSWWALEKLIPLNIPIFWWIHDAEAVYPWLSHFLPRELPPQVHIRCVGDYALSVLKKCRPQYEARSLIYGLNDLRQTADPLPEVQKSPRLVFGTVGTLEIRKGQDVLLSAISMLPEKVRSQCLFLLIGRGENEMIHSLVTETVKKYPDSVHYVPSVPHDKMPAVYRACDCLICSSRDDPMPTFLAEGWMFSVPCICSRNTGTAGLIRQGENGLIYEKDRALQLSARIQEFVKMEESARRRMGEKGRETFEKVFTASVFRENLLSAVSEIFENNHNHH